jgi:hypothetical protein
MRKIESLGNILFTLGLERESYRILSLKKIAEGLPSEVFELTKSLDDLISDRFDKMNECSEENLQSIYEQIKQLLISRGLTKIAEESGARDVFTKRSWNYVIKIAKNLSDDNIKENMADKNVGGPENRRDVFPEVPLYSKPVKKNYNNVEREWFPIWIVQEKVIPLKEVGEIGDYFEFTNFKIRSIDDFLAVTNTASYILDPDGWKEAISYSGDDFRLLNNRYDLDESEEYLKKKIPNYSIESFSKDLKTSQRFGNLLSEIRRTGLSIRDLGSENLGWDKDHNLVILDAG